MSADNSGGYDYQFIDPGPTNDQKCPICHLVVRDAHQVTCCGKLFCETCLRMSQQHHGLCPLCRQNYCGNYFKDVKSDREIRTLKVFCGYKSLGCEWIGELRDIEGHVSSCSYKGIKCPLCGVLEKSFLMDTHVKSNCPSRKYACPLCEEEGTYLNITTSHQNTCPEVVIECPNQDCTVHMKRREIAEHTSVCPKQRVLCSFTLFGCDFHDCRELVAEHMKAELQSHVELLGQKMETQISVIDNTISQIALRVEKIENTLARRSFTMKLTQFERQRQKNKIWYSNSFYTGVGGYKMRLIVYPNGNGNSVSTHVCIC